ncbi:hypothetical protein [Pseudoduganella violaceinigra]|uniref:hypothetical protein n=1 Tax=Pseudoduganella violaceinigra TaxID=246602 RepID=UPI00040F93DA|nr:hypothetical protein [Pseudoduganella violaceinigra]
MKATLIGAALLAAALAACGGKASFTVGGTINGLKTDGMVLQLNGGDTLPVPAGATTFSFPNTISYGTEYTVKVLTQPAHMQCDALNPTSSAGHTTSINVVIECKQKTYALNGSVVNYQGDGLQIINGGGYGTLTVAKTGTTFKFSGVPVGEAYGLSVLTQPTNPTQACTFDAGTASGVMGDGDRDVVLRCQ